MGPRPNALLLSGLCRRVGSEDSKALFFLLDLASGWSANLTTFSQAFPSAYNAPASVLFFGLLPNECVHLALGLGILPWLPAWQPL